MKSVLRIVVLASALTTVSTFADHPAGMKRLSLISGQECVEKVVESERLT